MRVTLDFPAAEEILQEVGLDEQGDTQMFHTKNVLRRIQKYMPYRTGATIKLTVAQTDPRVPEIVTEEPQAVYLYNDVSRSGKPLNYTKTKNPLAGGIGIVRLWLPRVMRWLPIWNAILERGLANE